MMMMMMMMQLAVNDGRLVSRDVVELCSCHVRVCVGAIVPARRLVVHLGLPVSRVAGVVGGPRRAEWHPRLPVRGATAGTNNSVVASSYSRFCRVASRRATAKSHFVRRAAHAWVRRSVERSVEN